MSSARITVYSYNDAGFFIGTDIAIESPMEPGSGIYLIPGNSTDVAPPPPIEGKVLWWTGMEWVHVEPPGADPMLVRQRRDSLLTACDWTQLPDVRHVVDQTAWASYRQQLRDIPQCQNFPHVVQWPTPPVKKC